MMSTAGPWGLQDRGWPRCVWTPLLAKGRLTHGTPFLRVLVLARVAVVAVLTRKGWSVHCSGAERYKGATASVVRGTVLSVRAGMGLQRP